MDQRGEISPQSRGIRYLLEAREKVAQFFQVAAAYGVILVTVHAILLVTCWGVVP